MNEKNDYHEEGLFLESNYKFQTIELSAIVPSMKLDDSDQESIDPIPMFVKIFYSMPSFSKMACLVLLKY